MGKRGECRDEREMHGETCGRRGGRRGRGQVKEQAEREGKRCFGGIHRKDNERTNGGTGTHAGGERMEAWMDKREQAKSRHGEVAQPDGADNGSGTSGQSKKKCSGQKNRQWMTA